MKILIIDDNEDDRMLYRRVLEKSPDASYEFSEAADGDAGLAQLQQAMPDCILLDYSLPGRNGIQVLKAIREQHAFIPVVMMTGQGSEAIAVKALHEGAQNYITKSNISTEALQHVVHAAVEHCDMERHIHNQREALEIFSRALAHDLKEPVRTIQSFLDLLAAHEGFSDEEQGYMRFIQSASDRMGTLIDAVHSYTRLDGMSPPVEEVCNVGGALQEAKENIKQLMDESQAVITHDPLPEISANCMHLLQIFQNLLCNAIHHADDRPRIHVSVTQRAGEWLFQVRDNGPGIPEAHRHHIFEPFRRMGVQRDQGMGLGLAVCKKIVESYGGKIWYEPAPEKGAVFLFTIPRRDGEAHSGGSNSEASPIKITSAASGETLARLMLVEDNEADIKLAKIMLMQKDKLKCELWIAHDGEEALQMLQTGAAHKDRVDLILLDINMPRMDGFSLLSKLKTEQQFCKIPVLMCSTSNDSYDVEKAKTLGAAGYLIKPLSLKKLNPMLDQLDDLYLQQTNDEYWLVRTTPPIAASVGK